MVYNRYIGIDYSGAKSPTSSLKGLRVYMADHSALLAKVQQPPSPRKYWTRRVLGDDARRIVFDIERSKHGLLNQVLFTGKYKDRQHLIAGKWIEYNGNMDVNG